MKIPGLLAAPFLIALGGAAWADAFTYTAADTPVTIVDAATSTSTLIVPAGAFGLIEDLNVLIDITHTFDADLRISLRHDDTGTTVMLVSGRGGSGQDFDDVTLDDEAAVSVFDFEAPGTGQSFIPEDPLAAFIGESLTGSWTLIVEDVEPPDSGTLNTFSISGIATPEPGTFAMFGLGLAGLAALTARRRRAAAAAAAVPSSSSRGRMR